MKFVDYVNNLPLLHTWDGGKNWNTGGFQRTHLTQLHEFITNPANAVRSIIETGAGNSSLTFLFARPQKLISILPPGTQDLVERIKKYAVDAEVPADCWQVEMQQSEFALPRLCGAAGNTSPFDFALIDGGHGMPTVFIDLYFSNRMLRPGGFLMLDDVNLHSVKEAARLLRDQPQFALRCDLGKALIFQKTAPFVDFGDWGVQPYVTRKTAEYASVPRPDAL